MNRSYPDEQTYQVPQRNVLLISCIDLRLTDALARFMQHENLVNRYDHYTLAGASLGATLSTSLQSWQNTQDTPAGKYDVRHFHPGGWRESLLDHVRIAIALHAIQDVYIVEHENCGAYQAFVQDAVLAQGEKACQKISSGHLAAELRRQHGLKVHCFRMDLRGNVQLLETEPG